MANRRQKGPKKQSKNQPKGTPQPQIVGKGAEVPEQVQPTKTAMALPARRSTAETVEPIQSFAQQRAAHAWKAVQDLLDEDGTEKAKHAKAKDNQGETPPIYGKYVSYLKALPATILMSGLGQALAMEKAAGRKLAGHKVLYHHMDRWLRRDWPSSPYTLSNDVIEGIIVKSEADYIRAQAEALEYLEWLKKFAVAYLDEPEEQEAGE